MSLPSIAEMTSPLPSPPKKLQAACSQTKSQKRDDGKQKIIKKTKSVANDTLPLSSTLNSLNELPSPTTIPTVSNEKKDNRVNPSRIFLNIKSKKKNSQLTTVFCIPASILPKNIMEKYLTKEAENDADISRHERISLLREALKTTEVYDVKSLNPLKIPGMRGRDYYKIYEKSLLQLIEEKSNEKKDILEIHSKQM